MVYMAPTTTTIRVSAETRDRLNEIARRRGATAGEVVTTLVREADERELLTAAAVGWDRMADDSRYREEAKALEGFDAPLPDY